MRPLCSDSGYPAVWNFGLELNFFIGKIKHTVRKIKKNR